MMTIVYSESHVKKKPLFSAGDPEPKLKEGELFIYLNQNGDTFVFGHEKTPISNSFIRKHKINYRIRMNAGPFSYQLSEEYVTHDHRKYLRVTIHLKLEIENAVKLYNSRVKNIETYLQNIVPPFVAGIVENYDIDDIIPLQKKIRDINVFPGLINDLKSIGLRVASYYSRVEKDSEQKSQDIDFRRAEHELKKEFYEETKRREFQHKVGVVDTVSKMEAILEIEQHYTKLIEEGSVEPTLLLETVDDPTLKKHLQQKWKEKGLLLEAPKQQSEFDLLDDLVDEMSKDTK